MDKVNKEINLLDLLQKIWIKRWFILIISAIGFLVGIIVSVSLPKEYSASVMLAPEIKSSGSSNMGVLAAMAGINLQQTSDDAISPDLYPSILGSTSFLISLFDINVEDKAENINTSLYNYLEEEQRVVWWSRMFNMPGKLIGFFTSKDSIIYENTDPNTEIKLTESQFSIIGNLRKRINVSVDKKTGLITLVSTMQSPTITAFMADTIASYLQKYIIDYRTQKAKQDLIFTERLFDEAKHDYYKAQQEYTTYVDKNLNIVSARYGAIKDRLQNEVTLTYTVYNQMAQQLQLAKVKVQNTTPVYTVIQRAVVPLTPESPKKKLIIIGFIFLSFAGACTWVLIKNYFNKNNIQ